jgi:hypothetical protein
MKRRQRIKPSNRLTPLEHGVNDEGELLAFCLTPGQVDDRQPVPGLTKALFGQLFGARGYISQALHDALFGDGLTLLTKVRTNMKNRLMRLWDKLLLRKRVLIETINDQLKNISQIEHTRHRSVTGLMVNLVAGLVAYSIGQQSRRWASDAIPGFRCS